MNGHGRRTEGSVSRIVCSVLVSTTAGHDFGGAVPNVTISIMPDGSGVGVAVGLGSSENLPPPARWTSDFDEAGVADEDRADEPPVEVSLVVLVAGDVDIRPDRRSAGRPPPLGRSRRPSWSGQRRRAPCRPGIHGPRVPPGRWVPEQIERAGGESVIGVRGERSRASSWEALAAADSDVVVLGLCGFDLPRARDEWSAFEPPAPLTRTKAWRHGQIWTIDGSAYVSRPGPRLVDGVEILAAVMAGRPDPRARRLPCAKVN